LNAGSPFDLVWAVFREAWTKKEVLPTPFPAPEPPAPLPKAPKGGQNILRHLENENARMTHHFPGHLKDSPNPALFEH